MEKVTVEKTCSRCGKKMTTELERDDFFECALRLYKLTDCWACGEFHERLENISKLKAEAWEHLRTAKSQHKKAEDSSRYGARGSSQRVSETARQVIELRQQIETLGKKEQKLLAECQEYKNEQRKVQP
jgi:hypothetical protein